MIAGATVSGDPLGSRRGAGRVPLAPLVALALAGFAAGCAPRALTPLERYQILSGEPDQEMAVVQDETVPGDEFLRAVALAVDPRDPVLHHLVRRMLATVLAAPGVGIAAPQVGVSRRVVWVQRLDKPDKPFEVYVNPRIVRRSETVDIGWEGCLSVSAGYGQVRRATWVELVYLDLAGRRVRERIEGFPAIIVQHEVDHLDGVLFVDRKEPGDLVPEEQYRAMRERQKAAEAEAEAEAEAAGEGE